MRSPNEYRASLILAGALAGAAMLSGGVASEPTYEHNHWDAREDQAYRAYLLQQHQEYREFRTLSGEQQREYWNWRSQHPDNPS
ncbi:MAG TPA: hypothetical protein VH109_10865 [Steroidobacteraceae bacterium]|jgi:hypothetical protein|nr:hypothetical protein [Steroidobacteraceae bacterium]